jgi:predicted phosphodiesterase
MKNLIFSDAHGKSIKLLLEKAKQEGIERVIGLGDYDTPEVLRELLASKFQRIVVVGNHDYHYIRGLPITGELMKGDLEDYALRWFNTPERKYLEEAINKPNQTRGLVVVREIKGRKIAFSHSSLTGEIDLEIGFPLCFWNRIVSQISAREEFKLMQAKKISILFRGHDHYSGCYTHQDKKEPQLVERLFKSQINLEPDARHIVCVGAYHHGEYCIFDDETLSLKFSGAPRIRIDWTIFIVVEYINFKTLFIYG